MIEQIVQMPQELERQCPHDIAERAAEQRFAAALLVDPDPRIEVRRRAAKAELKWEIAPTDVTRWQNGLHPDNYLRSSQ